MALDVSQWAQTLHNNQVRMAVQAGTYFMDGFVDMEYLPGVFQRRVPKTSRRSPTFIDDGNKLAVPSNTDTSVTIQAFDPIKVWDYVKYRDVNEYGQIVPTSLSSQIGTDLGEVSSDAKLGFIAATAADNGGTISYDPGATDDAKLAAIFAAFRDAVVQFDQDDVPQSDRYGIVDPEIMAFLRSKDVIASADYARGTDNSDSLAEMNPWGFKLYSKSAIFGDNNTGNTDLPIALRRNWTTLKAVFWQKHGFHIHQVERPNGTITDIPDEEHWLIRAREQWGIGAVYPEFARVLIESAT